MWSGAMLTNWSKMLMRKFMKHLLWPLQVLHSCSELIFNVRSSMLNGINDLLQF